MSKYDVVTIGASVLDTFARLKTSNKRPDKTSDSGAQECFALGSKIDVETIFQQSGGGASNSAVTFSRQGLNCVTVSKIGCDIAGRIIQDELIAEGVKTPAIIKVVGGKSGQSVVLVDPDGERTILTDRGSAGHITAEDLSILDRLESRWVYVTSLNGLSHSIDFVFHWARQKNIKIAWNPGWADLELAPPLLERYLSQADMLFVNRDEGNKIVASENLKVEVIAKKLISRNIRRAIITDGPASLAILNQPDIKLVHPHKVSAVDQTGAGDAFGSGVIAGLLKGYPFDKAIELGLLNSANVVIHLGAKTGIVYK